MAGPADPQPAEGDVMASRSWSRCAAGSPRAAPISNVRTVRLEDKQRGEWVSVQRPKRKVMDFRFVNGGYIDGINFNAGCAGRLGVHAWQVDREAGRSKEGRAHTAADLRRRCPARW